MTISSQQLFKSLKTARSVYHQVESMDQLRIKAFLIRVCPLISILATMTAGTIYKQGQVKTEIYWPTGQVDFNFILPCPAIRRGIILKRSYLFNCSSDIAAATLDSGLTALRLSSSFLCASLLRLRRTSSSVL